ncbi:hypothetical protein [Haladaptatus sp. CMAA 1911]|uniref:hypothetical protein n=1 Tax=unclassified Haladaptatus TaxID=2622732 RepID=UPI00375513AD
MNTIETRTQRSLLYVAIGGAVGWVGTYGVNEVGPFSLELDIYFVVAIWAVLLLAGVLWVRTAPTIRRANAWRIWVYLSGVALAVNAVANTPRLVPNPDLFMLLQEYAYYHPWFAVYAIGYVATARYEPESGLMGGTERTMYVVSGAFSLAFLVALLTVLIPDEHVILAGGLLNVLPPLLAIYIRRWEAASASRDRIRVTSGEKP